MRNYIIQPYTFNSVFFFLMNEIGKIMFILLAVVGGFKGVQVTLKNVVVFECLILGK